MRPPRRALPRPCADARCARARQSRELLHRDLLRRIKMLEFALRSERRRYREAAAPGAAAAPPGDGAAEGGAGSAAEAGDDAEGDGAATVPPTSEEPVDAVERLTRAPRATEALVARFLSELDESSMTGAGKASVAADEPGDGTARLAAAAAEPSDAAARRVDSIVHGGGGLPGPSTSSLPPAAQRALQSRSIPPVGERPVGQAGEAERKDFQASRAAARAGIRPSDFPGVRGGGSIRGARGPHLRGARAARGPPAEAASGDTDEPRAGPAASLAPGDTQAAEPAAGGAGPVTSLAKTTSREHGAPGPVTVPRGGVRDDSAPANGDGGDSDSSEASLRNGSTLQADGTSKMVSLEQLLNDFSKDGGPGNGNANAIAGVVASAIATAEASLGDAALAAASAADHSRARRAAPWAGPKRGSQRAWRPRLALKSHLDSVKCVCWHPTQLLLLSGSEDGTAKVWSAKAVSRPGSARRSADVEPLRTFRGHSGPVLCATFVGDGSVAVTGGADGRIIHWAVPDDGAPSSPYAVGSSATFPQRVFVGHGDAVWGLSAELPGLPGQTELHLYSVSADASLRVWRVATSGGAPMATAPSGGAQDGADGTGSLEDDPAVVAILTSERDLARCVPTAVCADQSSPGPAAFVGGTLGEVLRVDTATKSVVWSTRERGGDPARDSRVVALAMHPTLPVVASAGADGGIRLLDAFSGKWLHNIQAHRGPVASVAMDATGMHLASTAADGCVRVWSVADRTCLWDLKAHRHKWGEAGQAVAFHVNAGVLASGGADGVIKLFQ